MKVLMICEDKREWILPRPGHPGGPLPVASVELTPDQGIAQGGLWEGRPPIGRLELAAIDRDRARSFELGGHYWIHIEPAGSAGGEDGE